MRIPIIPFLAALAISFVIDFYIFKKAKQRCQSKIPHKIHIWASLLQYILLVVAVFIPMRTGENSILLTKMWCLFAYMTLFIPKLIFVLFDLLESLPKLINRKRFSGLSILGGLIAFLTFCLMWWGALINRFDIDVTQETVVIENLPEAFDDYKIIQISDLHVGTYGDNTEFIARLVDYLNNLNPDLIAFTGDIVNRKTDEITLFKNILSDLTASDGVVSILGNHDYGDYYNWDSDSAKAQSLTNLINIQNEMGWNLLLNQHLYIKHGSDSIAVIGVEDIGDPPFTVRGDLKASYPDLSDNVTKILLSHNPTHWSNEIADNRDISIALTLSGHTHAMQFELFGLSPAVLRYNSWKGMYSDKANQHKLYVNIGIGTVALPMRIGATPEITIITLKRS